MVPDKIQSLTELEPILQAALARAREAWPGLEVEPERFVRFLAEQLAAGEEPVRALQAINAEDLYLARACLDGDRAALDIWERSFRASLAAAVAGVDPSPGFVDEVLQRLWEKLLLAKGGRRAGLASYSGRGPLASWLKVSALRLAISLKRGKQPGAESDADALLDLVCPGESPDLQYVKARYRPAFEEALRAALRALSPRERNVLRMYYVEGLGTERIGAVYRVHSSTVSRWMGRAREELMASVRERVVSQLQLRTSEFDSLLELMRSQINLGLSKILKPPAK